jgi:hypothetical protein
MLNETWPPALALGAATANIAAIPEIKKRFFILLRILADCFDETN